MLLQTNHRTEQLSHCILAPPYLPLPAAGSELVQPVRLQRLVLLLLRHLQEQRVGELQPLGQLQGQQGSSHVSSLPCVSRDPSHLAGHTGSGTTASLRNRGVRQQQPLVQDSFPLPHRHGGAGPSRAPQSQQGWLSTPTEMPKHLCQRCSSHQGDR